MKKYLVSLLVIVIFGCSSQKNISKFDKQGNMVGIVVKEDFLKEPFSKWYLENYNLYKVDEQAINELKGLLENIKMKVFLGTWCGDSREHIPTFFKVLDKTEFNYKNVEIIALNRKKKTPTKLEEGFDIKRVPTFIFYRNNIEIGRVIEFPSDFIETDMVEILSK